MPGGADSLSLDVENWAARYARAWEEGDENAVAALFTEDASYRSQIFREPHVGLDEIRAYWRRGAGTSKTDVRVRMGRPFVDGNRAAVEWWATFDDVEDGQITLPGCLLLRFAEDGRCADLREYWEVAPGRQEPPPGWGE
jgi:ketosteroid isomerase-like protein